MNLNAASVGIKKPFMMTVVARTLTFAGGGNFLIMAANREFNKTCHFIEFGDVGINAVIDQRSTDTLQFVISPFTIATDTRYHVYTSAYDGVNLKLRIDGIEVDSIAAGGLTAPCSINQICIGGTAPNKIVDVGNSYLTGNVATVVAYTALPGVPCDYSHEEYLLNYYNLPTR